MGTENGERSIAATEAVRTGQTDAPVPLFLRGRHTGGRSYGPEYPAIADTGGPSNTGLFARAAGRVTRVLDATHFVMDDGSGVADPSGASGVRVEAASTSLPAIGDFVNVTGASGSTAAGQSVAPMLRASSDASIVPRNLLGNPSFETGSVSGWSRAGVAGEVLSGPWFGVYARSGTNFWTRSSTLGAGSGTLYQHADVAPGEHLIARAYCSIYRTQNQAGDAKGRVGIDPAGGTDPSAASVVWSAWDSRAQPAAADWRLISTPEVSAQEAKVTVFLEAWQGPVGIRIICFDDAGLFAQQ